MDVRYEATRVVSGEAIAAVAEGLGSAIAGYHLQQRLGGGGYGEVWRAIGPGGLHKAVKILHGRYDGPEADTELKSLERMRELRHPFLLNVERIEIVEGRLIIVTELAEGSLEQSFRELQRQGQKGIPRDTLLDYLRDAADALDFMHQRHGLQHLDVKPGNLLLQGGHVKVADFGLIHDLRHACPSMIKGFTPLYAPPELFEARPHENSDQYSLAIVYQVMLTGTPPFAGRNTAQLMSQHLSSPPDLTPLAPPDRPAMARALSKNPRVRFATCRQFLDHLARRGASLSGQRLGRAAPPAVAPAWPPGLAAQPLDSAAAPDRSAALAEDLPDAQETLSLASATSVATRPLPPLAVDPAGVTYRPTLLLGIGGLGGLVLSHVRQRLVESFGEDRPLTALPLLYVDTDPRAIAAAWARDDHCRLTASETLCMPLRDPQFYRSRHAQALHWISRRWLFNIPRSRQVEGIRPLGRLALFDHQEALRNRIREILPRAMGDDSLRAAQEATGARFTSGPATVYVVASLCGGTGSGAALDTAYLLRTLLAEINLECQAVVGVLLYATSAKSDQGMIQTATALACLDELRHFSTPGLGFPGDPACRLPSFDRGPFDQTYVVDVGEGLGEADYQKEAQKVAEYLFRCTATRARGFFEVCRRRPQSGGSNRAGTPTLRTFAVGMADQPSSQDAGPEVRALCQAIVRAWRGGPPSPAQEARAHTAIQPPPLTAEEGLSEAARGTRAALTGQPSDLPPTGDRREATPDARAAGAARPLALPLDAEHWSGQAAALLRGELGRKADSHFLAKWEQVQRLSAEQKIAPELPLGAIDRDFAAAGPPMGGQPRPVVSTWILDELAPVARACNAAITTKILAMIDAAEYRLAGARGVLADVESRLEETATVLAALIDEMGKDLAQVRRRVSAACGGEGAEPAFRDFTPQQAAVYQEYCRIRLCENVHRCLLDRVRDVQATVKHLAGGLTALDGRFQELDARLSEVVAAPPGDGGAEASPPGSPEPALDPAASVAFLASAFESRVRANPRLRPSSLLGGGSEAAQRLLAALGDEAARFLQEHLASSDASDDASPATARAGGSCEAAAMPRLMNLGGGCRLLGVDRDEASLAVCKQKLQAAFGDCVTTQQDATVAPFICCEVEGIDIESLASQLGRQDGRLIEMASRVHTRIDIQW
jgi:hypothetical protein